MFSQVGLKNSPPPAGFAYEGAGKDKSSEEGDELALALEHGLGESFRVEGGSPGPEPHSGANAGRWAQLQYPVLASTDLHSHCLHLALPAQHLGPIHKQCWLAGIKFKGF